MRVFVTGVTSGIGRSLLTRLVSRGDEVWGLGRRPKALAALQAELGDRFTPVCADLSRPEDLRRVVEGDLGEGCPDFDAVVHNAALCVWSGSLALEQARWEALLQTNLLAVVALTRALVSKLTDKGQIVTVSSVAAGHVAHPAFGPYALTKAALDHFTDSLRLELSPQGIRVCSLAPGLVDTEIYDKVDGFEKMEARLRKGVPRWLSSEDVAQTLTWMLDQPAHLHVARVTLLPTGQPR